MPPKIVLYAHDGSGFGHLVRISRLAAALQGRCACLVLTGLREAAWLVDGSCEYVKLPSWQTMYRSSSSATGGLWLELPKAEVVAFRSAILEGVLRGFAPDALVVDHLPYGLRDELRAPLAALRSRKYLLMRGVVDSVDRPLRDALASSEVAALYDRFLVAADRRVTDALDDLPLNVAARAKADWVGYMTAPLGSGSLPRGSGPPHVVCSAGSGLRGERLFGECVRLAYLHPRAKFDLVLGSRGELPPSPSPHLPENVSVSRTRPDLPALHRSADVVITSGGYNSLLEALTGGAEVIVCPVNTGAKDEQLRHARQLQTFYPLTLIAEPSELQAPLGAALDQAARAARRRFSLDTGGIERARDIIERDLGVAGT